jgi:hypothetical protein
MVVWFESVAGIVAGVKGGTEGFGQPVRENKRIHVYRYTFENLTYVYSGSTAVELESNSTSFWS